MKVVTITLFLTALFGSGSTLGLAKEMSRITLPRDLGRTRACETIRALLKPETRLYLYRSTATYWEPKICVSCAPRTQKEILQNARRSPSSESVTYPDELFSPAVLLDDSQTKAYIARLEDVGCQSPQRLCAGVIDLSGNDGSCVLDATLTAFLRKEGLGSSSLSIFRKVSNVSAAEFLQVCSQEMDKTSLQRAFEDISHFMTRTLPAIFNTSRSGKAGA